MNALAQTFFVNESQVDVSGIYVTRLDLFFKSRDTTHGIVVQLCECENGVPTRRVVPFSRVRLAASQVNVSTNGMTATPFVFRAPVFLFAQREYCFQIIPEGNSINYQVWVAELGGTDVTSANNRVITQNASTGTLFSSATGRAWTAYQYEDIKFVLYRATFTANTGHVTFENANTEYLLFDDIYGTFNLGELVSVSNGIVTIQSNASFGSNGTVVAINNGATNAQTAVSANKVVYLRSNTGTRTIVRKVTSVPNTTHFVVNGAVTFNDNNASIGHMYSNGGLMGELSVIHRNRLVMHLDYSTANSTMNFAALQNRAGYAGNSYLIGLESGASANLVVCTNINYSTVVPQFSVLGVPRTSLTFGIKGVAFTSNSTDSTFTTVQNDADYNYYDKLRKVMSRSNELYFKSGAKSLVVNVALRSDTSKLSPTIDTVRAGVLTIRNVVDSTNTTLLTQEQEPDGGRVFNKYISKRVQLAEGQDAEDMIVYLTAYRPFGTDISVFCKLLNRTDNEGFDNKYWTPMSEITPRYSSKADPNNFIELQYGLPAGNDATILTTAFLNSDNSNVARYFTSSNSYFDGYATFAIKIILTANASYIVPRVADMRAIAVQA